MNKGGEICYIGIEGGECTPKHYKHDLLGRPSYRWLAGKLSLRTVRQTQVATAKEDRLNKELSKKCLSHVITLFL